MNKIMRCITSDGSIMAAAIISILYSYLFYKKKLATGEGLKIQYNTKNTFAHMLCVLVNPTKTPMSITRTEQINEPLYFFIISFIVRCSFQVCYPQHDIFQYGSV